MKQALKLVFLIAYTITIFLINNVILLGIILLCNLIFIIILKTNVKQMIYTIYRISLFILITFLINVLLSDLRTAALVLTKLILSFSFVYSYRKLLPPMELGEAVETICMPLKIFGINISDISLIVNMSVTFVPILTKELEQINTSLKSRGIQKYGITKIHKKLQYILMPWLYNTFERTNSLELALKAKGYSEK